MSAPAAQCAPAPAQAVPALPDIVAAVARFCGLSRAALRGSARHPRLVRARFVAYAVARHWGHSLSQIGAALGGRDHTTVLRGLERAEALIAAGGEFAALYQGVRDYLALTRRRGGDDAAALRGRVVARLADATGDELACVARFLGVGDE